MSNVIVSYLVLFQLLSKLLFYIGCCSLLCVYYLLTVITILGSFLDTHCKYLLCFVKYLLFY